ncbi:MAG: type VI secretion system tip protein VgrG [Anaerolineae bacterium]|nr:type VI secretion system tip protein VgrG [Anaerolineae bacterium]
MEELHCQFERVEGEGDVAGLASGGLFELTDYPREDQNREYLIVSSAVELRSDDYESQSAAKGETLCHCRFTAIDGQRQFRAPRVTPKPVVQGPQTAIVVGKSGEEIWTDKHGRVKVQFHWDREGKSDENSSCWIRVSHPWAGKGWGAVAIPRMGQEVVVDFLEGDPDQPIITGRVYNANNMPPESLPGQRTKSVWRDHGGNETIMEGMDKKQFIHTQQTCGNEILMDGTEGEEKIEIRDKYGNEIKLDAVEGFMRLYSPTHESSIEIGRSIFGVTLSDLKWNISRDAMTKVKGKSMWECGGEAHKLTIGATSEEFIGLKHTSNLAVLTEVSASLKLEENLLQRVVRSRVHNVDASNYAKFVAGKGNASLVKMDSSQVEISCGSSKVVINKDGDVEIKATGKCKIKGDSDVTIEGPKITIGAEYETDLKYAPVNHKYLKVG